MSKIIKTKVYQLNELTEDAKETAREWYRGGALDYEWYDSVYEDAKTIAGLMGINIDKIYFSGFPVKGMELALRVTILMLNSQSRKL